MVPVHEYPMLLHLNVLDDEAGLGSVSTLHFYEMPWIPTGIYTFQN